MNLSTTRLGSITKRAYFCPAFPASDAKRANNVSQSETNVNAAGDLHDLHDELLQRLFSGLHVSLVASASGGRSTIRREPRWPAK